jgi:hypothetical protein
VARRVFVHVGLPKTGTTYVQSVLWANRPALAEQGVTYPGGRRRLHLWATLEVRERPHLDRRNPAATGSWRRLLAAVEAAPDTALVSHEFLGAASAEQAQRALSDLGHDGEVETHVIVTARDLLTVLTSYWQEYVKHGFDCDLDDFPAGDEPGDEWGWSAIDLAGVLERWGSTLPPERVHVLVLPEPGSPRETLVRQFTQVLGADGTGFDFEAGRPNRSLGVVEAELLRRISPRLDGFTSPLDRGVWVRGYLAHDVLVPRGGAPFLPSATRVAELAAHAAATVARVQEAGYDVVGDLARLRVQTAPASVRHPQDVTTAELLDAALDTVSAMMTDLRALRRDNTALRAAAAAAPVVPPREPVASRFRGWAGRLRSRG